jgi:hypothetical protein
MLHRRHLARAVLTGLRPEVCGAVSDQWIRAHVATGRSRSCLLLIGLWVPTEPVFTIRTGYRAWPYDRHCSAQRNSEDEQTHSIHGKDSLGAQARHLQYLAQLDIRDQHIQDGDQQVGQACRRAIPRSVTPARPPRTPWRCQQEGALSNSYPQFEVSLGAPAVPADRAVRACQFRSGSSRSAGTRYVSLCRSTRRKPASLNTQMLARPLKTAFTRLVL